MANGEFGNLEPRLVIQEDPKACLSACILSQLPEDQARESDITALLQEEGLYKEGYGVDLEPAKMLEQAVIWTGIEVDSVYEARLASKDEATKSVERLAAIQTAILDGKSVLIAYPKRREGKAPFTHYSVVTGYKESPDGGGVKVMDPSEIDGGVSSPSWTELLAYVTPTEDVPVMAWAISEARGEEKPLFTSKIEEGGLPGFDLLAQPIYKEEDTGKAIPPGTAHATSVSIPTSEITQMWAQLGDVILSRGGELPNGYPRFVINPAIRALAKEHAGSVRYLPFPSKKAAQAALYLDKTYGQGGAKPLKLRTNDICWVEENTETLKAWQYSGQGLSSRQALATLEGTPINNIGRRIKAEDKIKSVIQEYTGAPNSDIYLFPNGAAATYWMNQAIMRISGEQPSAQFGFPYADTYSQNHFGPHKNAGKNVLDFRNADYQALKDRVTREDGIRAVHTEYPSNPLLWTPNLEQLDYCVGDDAPIILDDTIGSIYNLDDSKLPSSVVARITSLTKYFSSVGDVMGGSIVLRRDSPHYERAKRALDEIYEDTLWYEDAEALAANSKLFPFVMTQINQNGAEIAEWLDEEWGGDGPLDTVYHPTTNARREYDALRKKDGGYGGLMSLLFKDPDRGFKFFDELKVTKGPSLGTYFTIGCLYTLLAHRQTSAVAKYDVVPDLVRLSIGTEDVDEMKGRIDEAMQASA